MRKLFFATLFVLSVFALTGCNNQPKVVSVDVVPDVVQSQAVPVVTTTTAASKPAPDPVATLPAKQTKQIPDKYLLTMAFSQQAPFANWDKVHEEACEEASMIMVDKYFKRQPLNEQIMEQELQKLLTWESERGYKVDLTASETVDVLKAYFGISAHLSGNVTADQIKYELSQGKPIIAPAAGRALGNPNFKQPGPIYHMLVIKGYNNSQFITNDPGTRKGNGYAYSYSALLNAVHNWNSALATTMTAENMLQGEKVLVVVDK